MEPGFAEGFNGGRKFIIVVRRRLRLGNRNRESSCDIAENCTLGFCAAGNACENDDLDSGKHGITVSASESFFDGPLTSFKAIHNASDCSVDLLKFHEI